MGGFANSETIVGQSTVLVLVSSNVNVAIVETVVRQIPVANVHVS